MQEKENKLMNGRERGKTGPGYFSPKLEKKCRRWGKNFFVKRKKIAEIYWNPSQEKPTEDKKKDPPPPILDDKRKREKIGTNCGGGRREKGKFLPRSNQRAAGFHVVSFLQKYAFSQEKNKVSNFCHMRLY